MSFDLVGLPALSRFAIDRCEPLRGDDEKLAALWPKARMIVVDTRGRTLVADRGVRLADRPAVEFGDLPPVNAVLLGEQDGVAYFAVLMPAEDGEHLAVPGVVGYGEELVGQLRSERVDAELPAATAARTG
ncbi:MAG: diphosphatase, partial [Pseudonocardiales bacterium]|nr:diphosphatase [Pseudonocardiales bacterium]